MEAAAEGAKALTKFQEIIQKLFNPKWTMRQADADAYADARKLQTIRENPDMEIVFVGNEMHARERTPEAYAFRAGQRELTDSIRQERNLENVFDITVNEVRSVESVSDDPVDEDWIVRFFSIVKDVNSAEMQQVWGKILAGEITQPSSFSIKTLETLRCISKKDAEYFQMILPYLMESARDILLYGDTDLLATYGIPFDVILALDDCGLISFHSTVELRYIVSDSVYDSICNEELQIRIFAKDTGNYEFHHEMFTLTKAGRELYSVLEHQSNADFVTDVAKDICSRNNGKIRVFIHEIDTFVNGQKNWKSLALKEIDID